MGFGFKYQISYTLNCLASTKNQWNPLGFFLSGVEGAAQGAATFGIAFLGGKTGLFNKLGNFKTNSDFYMNYGSLGNGLTSFFHASKMLIGDTLSKTVFTSGAATIMRWLIDLIIPDVK